MKTLIVGNLPVFDEAVSALYAEHGTEVGRLASLREVLAQPSLEPLAVLAPLSSAEDVDLLPALAARKVQVLLVADVVAPHLRAGALEHGAMDVLFPPVSAAQVAAALGAMRGQPPARISRHRAGFPAVLQQGREGQPIDVTVVNLSSAELEAEIPWSGPAPGAVLRATLQPPPPQKPVQVHCRVLTSTTLSTGGVRVTARFVGLTSEEADALVDLVDTLPPWPEELAQVLATIDSIDVAVLRQVAAGQSTPVRLPAFTPLEEEALSSGWGTDAATEDGVAEAAVARVCAALLADVMEADPLMPGRSRVAHVLGSLQTSQEALRKLANGIPDGEGERLQKVRDLQKRLASSAERLQSLAGLAKAPAGPVLKAVRRSPLEDALERLPPGSARWAFLAGVPIAVLVLLGLAVKLVFFPGDAARSAVAADPKMTVMGIRVVEVESGADGAVAVVDGSWFTATEDERTRLSRIVRQSVEGAGSLEVRDVRGRPLAEVKGNVVTLLPLPAPRDTPPPRPPAVP